MYEREEDTGVPLRDATCFELQVGDVGRNDPVLRCRDSWTDKCVDDEFPPNEISLRSFLRETCLKNNGVSKLGRTKETSAHEFAEQPAGYHAIAV